MPKLTRLLIGACLCALLLPAAPTAGILYQLHSAAAGVQITTDGLYFGRGIAIHDIDSDGDLDLYASDGTGRPNRMFLNNGAFSFTEVVGAWGADDPTGNTKCAVFADYDNDGDQDLFLARHAQDNKLFRNDGAVFVDVTATAMVAGSAEHSYGACWGDVDNDGLLDLFVGNRGDGGPDEANLLYRNLGGGVFSEVGAAWDVDDSVMTLQPGFTDYDFDGDLDLYLANDKMQGNRLYRNDGGVFTDVSVAHNADLVMDAMSVATGDVNLDGLPDIYITNTPSGNRCLVSHPDSVFVERADSMATTVGGVGWGAAFVDMDLDGDEDLFEVNMVSTPNKIFENAGGYPWLDKSLAAQVNHVAESFGAAYGDLDEDGDVDLYVANTDTCHIYRNVSTGAGHWLQFTLEGTASNRDGIGARVEIEYAGVIRFREIRAGSSYLSQMMSRAYFGTGAATTVDVVRVRWPSGAIDTWSNVATDQKLHLVEGATVSTPGPGSPAAVLRAHPNPFQRGTRVQLSLSDPATVRFQVIDAAGRRVRAADLGLRQPGEVSWTWDGQNERGHPAPAGVYWIRTLSTQAAPVRVVRLP